MHPMMKTDGTSSFNNFWKPLFVPIIEEQLSLPNPITFSRGIFFSFNNDFTELYRPAAVPSSTTIYYLRERLQHLVYLPMSKYLTTTAKTCVTEMSVLSSIIIENFCVLHILVITIFSSKAIPS